MIMVGVVRYFLMEIMSLASCYFFSVLNSSIKEKKIFFGGVVLTVLCLWVFGNFIYLVYTLFVVLYNRLMKKESLLCFNNGIVYIGAIFSLTVGGCISFLFNFVFIPNASVNKLITCQLVSESVVLVILYFYRRYVQIGLSKLRIYLYRHKLTKFFQCSILLAYIFILSLQIIAEELGVEMRIEGGLMLISMIIILIVLGFTISLSKYYNRVNQLEYVKRGVSQSQEYLAFNRRDYLRLRKLRHKYVNQLISLDGLLENGDYLAAKGYLNNILKEFNQSINSEINLQYQILNELSSVELRSLIFSKVQLMHEYNISCNLSVNTDFPISEENAIDVVTVIGSLLDNAIEETRDKYQSRIELELNQYGSEILDFKVVNTIDHEIDNHKLFQNEYSTKTGHSGIGLTIIKDIIDSSDNYALEIETYKDRIQFDYMIRRDPDDN